MRFVAKEDAAKLGEGEGRGKRGEDEEVSDEAGEVAEGVVEIKQGCRGCGRWQGKWKEASMRSGDEAGSGDFQR